MVFHRIYWDKEFDWKNYSKAYDEYCKLQENYYSQSAKVLVGLMDFGKSSKIIDLACGTGALSTELLKDYPDAQIFAIDLARDVLSYYENNFKSLIGKGQVEVACGNAEEIHKLTTSKVDTIFVTSAMWDVDIDELLKNANKVLNKEGVILFNLPSVILGEKKGFIFFIEDYFRKAMGTNMLYKRIDLDKLMEMLEKRGFELVSSKEYCFKMSRENVEKFFDLLKYRYPFIFFPEELSYKEKLQKCTEIFKDSLESIPDGGIKEEGRVFVIRKR